MKHIITGRLTYPVAGTSQEIEVVYWDDKPEPGNDSECNAFLDTLKQVSRRVDEPAPSKSETSE